MSKLFEQARRSMVSFCERCGVVCDGRCRTAALRERAQQRRLWSAGGIR